MAKTVESDLSFRFFPLRIYIALREANDRGELVCVNWMTIVEGRCLFCVFIFHDKQKLLFD